VSVKLLTAKGGKSEQDKERDISKYFSGFDLFDGGWLRKKPGGFRA